MPNQNKSRMKKHLPQLKKRKGVKDIIGKYIEVIDSKSECLIGIRGKVVDETKNTIVVETDQGLKSKRKRLLKQSVVFRLFPESQDFEGSPESTAIIIDGRSIMKRPEDRI